MNRDDSERSKWAWIGAVCGLALGVVLLVSTYTKALDPAGFAAQMARDGLMPESLAHPAALLVIALEGAIGISLVVLIRRLPIVGSATLMMVGFLGLSIWQWFSPPEDPSSCGCFGNLVQQTPAQHAAINALFLLLALGAWVGRARRPARALRTAWWVVPAAAFALLLGFAWASPSLAIDEWPGATRLVPGVDTATLRIDEVIPEVQEGRQLILLIDRADETTRLEIQRVNELLVLAGAPLGVYGIAEANEELASEFFWTAGPAFDVRSAPYSLIKPLYRALPRTFLVEQGIVTRIWNEIPSEETLVALAEGGRP